MEKQRDKAAKRMQRKLEKQSPVAEEAPEDDIIASGKEAAPGDAIASPDALSTKTES